MRGAVVNRSSRLPVTEKIAGSIPVGPAFVRRSFSGGGLRRGKPANYPESEQAFLYNITNVLHLLSPVK